MHALQPKVRDREVEGGALEARHHRQETGRGLLPAQRHQVQVSGPQHALVAPVAQSLGLQDVSQCLVILCINDDDMGWSLGNFVASSWNARLSAD